MERSSPRRWATACAVVIVTVATAATAAAAAAAGQRSASSSGSGQRLPFVTGPIEHASCDVETVERANARQLSSVLSDILDQPFFRMFQVNLDKECPFWDKSGKARPLQAAQGDEEKFASNGGDADEEEGESCASASEALGLDEPACSLKGASDLPFGMPSGGTSSPLPTSQHSLPWGPTTDHIEGQQEEPGQEEEEPDCEDPEKGEFWLDMCRNFQPSDGAKYVDLRKNPERWTGYNGSHIWAAIYSENCFSISQDMCYEERVLYKLLSGMHSSVNIHIAQHYFPPSKRHGRKDWAPNPAAFRRHFDQHPEWLTNVHFAFVVLLRAVQRATPVLYNHSYSTEVTTVADAQRTKLLVRRLLDSHILHSCSDVFSAFDESLLFGDAAQPSTVQTLKTNFKGVFQNVSTILDCVTCQKCKLHGKVALLGLGTALKVLLLPERLLHSPDALSRLEVTALINTVGKFSAAITGIEELTRQSWEASYFKTDEPSLSEAAKKPSTVDAGSAASSKDDRRSSGTSEDIASLVRSVRSLLEANTVATDAATSPGILRDTSLMDRALSTVTALTARGLLSDAEEDALVDRTLSQHADVLLLSKHFGDDPARFHRHARRRGLLSPGLRQSPGMSTTTLGVDDGAVDAVVVGGGLAGLTAAVQLVDRGASVTLVEKNAFFGGNSAYASSGLNAVSADSPPPMSDDSLDQYTNDTLESSGGTNTATRLVPVLTGGSFAALSWVRQRVGLPLEKIGQLGGHSHARTYRPSTGMAGSEIIFALSRIVKDLQSSGRLRVLLKHRLTRIMTRDGRATGVVAQELSSGEAVEIRARNVILATGGYANDRGSDSLLAAHRPDLLHFATTNGAFATGDGHKLAAAIGAETTELDHVQVHPTAFVDVKRPNATRKTLCAELLRGVGGILLDPTGMRFANELGKRDYLVGRMQENAAAAGRDDLRFFIVLNKASAGIADKHVPHYEKKGLLRRFAGRAELASWMGVSPAVVAETLDGYSAIATRGGTDTFGKSVFANAGAFSTGPYYAGYVTPALHYTMGGLSISERGEALRSDGSVFPGLYVAGEATGGIHGVNRLGGNALTECVVFGQIVAQSIPLRNDRQQQQGGASQEASQMAAGADSSVPASRRAISADELSSHATETSAWVAIGGDVYDMTEFLEEHPAGPESILDVAGKDATEVFESVHTAAMLEDFEPIGRLA